MCVHAPPQEPWQRGTFCGHQLAGVIALPLLVARPIELSPLRPLQSPCSIAEAGSFEQSLLSFLPAFAVIISGFLEETQVALGVKLKASLRAEEDLSRLPSIGARPQSSLQCSGPRGVLGSA